MASASPLGVVIFFSQSFLLAGAAVAFIPTP